MLIARGGAPGHRIYDVSIYTMSLFIAGLALKNDLLDTTKLGILIASAMAAGLWYSGSYWTTRKLAPSSASQREVCKEIGTKRFFSLRTKSFRVLWY